MSFTHDQMPMYTHDHAAYHKQMYDWHMKMHHYHDQLKAHHLERAKHFHGLMAGTTHHGHHGHNGHTGYYGNPRQTNAIT
ncbi:hypothetical protein OB236_16355 [Paenibacillus sp. WQ 127069]|uniref:Cytosolic protein n=1 Tax=Paenibacillus baimaensis TaxID=2982185 RepID=A0ABT2UGC7_9BACL|nr:hypothetical protein [Paenibacillus sp. WQ 127069]MCU6793679.1 hypothetical protein [Paenibacillus sp. WQ 127069]